MRRLFLPLLLCLTAFAGFAQTTSYCVPVIQSGNQYGYVGAVQLGTINNTTGQNAAASNSYYSYTTAPEANQTTALAQGSSQTITVDVENGGGVNSVSIWIDFNADGDFDDTGEQVVVTATNLGNGNVSFPFTVPATAVVGPTRLRVCGRYFYNMTTPCATSYYGETEDYTVNIVGPLCTGILALGNAVTSNAGPVCSATSFNLWVNPTVAVSDITYQWQVSTTGESGQFTDIAGKTTPTTTITGQTQNSWYRLKSLCTSSGQSDFSGAINVTQQVAANCYCIPPYQYDTRYAYNGYARLGTINYINVNAPAWDVPNGYFSYVSAPAPNQTTDLAQSSSQMLTFTVAGNGYNSGAAWIDYNQDGDFNDPGELLGTVVGQPIGQADITFIVPVTALLGPTRLRIIETAGSYAPDPCTTPNNAYGETDDYTVNITGPCTGTYITLYLDADGDGFGNPNVTGTACSSSTPPHGWVTNNTDCDDTKLLYADNDHDGYGAGAPVACGVPNNTDCDDTDPNVHGPITLYRDSDHDGFGNPNDSITVCPRDLPSALSAGYTVNDNSDCDDTKWLYVDADGDGYAGTKAACGVPDNTDCNDADRLVHTTIIYFADADKDGYGDHNSPVPACSSTPPPGSVNNADDCDDTNPQINPNTVWYLDADGDGYYTGTGITSCVAPPTGGYKYTGLLGGSDCDDANAFVHTQYPFYVDQDGDGYGTGSLVNVCAVDANTPPTDYSLNNTDCDDNDKTKWQSASLYIDSDGDGYDNGTTSICYGATVPQGYSSTTLGSDCNDQDANVHAQFSFYVDSDKDGYGAGSPVSVCAVDANTPPIGYSTNNTDCAPSDATVWQNCAVTYSLFINDVSMNEGNKGKSNMTFTVTLNKVFNKKVTVQYTTQNGTATAGSDYTAKSGTLTFKPGSTTQNIAISIIGDKTVEPNETFTVVLSNPVNAALLKGAGTGTIVNDDGPVITTMQAMEVQADAREVSGKLTVKVSPNPSPSYFTLHTQSGSDKPLLVRTVDALGRVIETRGGVPANGTLMLGSNYRPGIYFTEVLQGNNRVIVKLIKQSN